MRHLFFGDSHAAANAPTRRAPLVEQSAALGDCDSLSARAHSEAAVQQGRAVAHGLWRDSQRRGDLRGRPPAGEQSQQGGLVTAGPASLRAVKPQQQAEERGSDVALLRGCGADRGQQIGTGIAFEDEPGGSGGDAVEQGVDVRHGQHHDHLTADVFEAGGDRDGEVAGAALAQHRHGRCAGVGRRSGMGAHDQPGVLGKQALDPEPQQLGAADQLHVPLDDVRVHGAKLYRFTGIRDREPGWYRHSPVSTAITSSGVWKTFRLPHDRPFTLKQRFLHPRQSRQASELHALRDVSFEVREGEFFGIIGRNGSGKSTMLKCLAGIYQPNRGSLTTAGRVSPFIELGVGFNPELTALDNVVVNAALLGMPRAEAIARFPAIIEFAELERFVDLKLKNYSSGMQVRLGFASMIQAEADIYLVDEVLAVGDARFQEKCFDTFRRLKRDGRTVVFVTHDLASVERFCDRVVLLDQGQVVADGDPHRVIMDYRQKDLEAAQAGRPGDFGASNRWGDGAAQIEDAWFEDSNGRRVEAVAQGGDVTLRISVRFHLDMEEPIFGAILKGEDGRAVWAVNTTFDRVATGHFQGGDTALYSVRFPVMLADGAYSTSPAVSHQDAQRIADWREDAVSLRVHGESHTGGLVDLPHDARVERATGGAGESRADGTTLHRARGLGAS